jgi:hypothetical protein
MDSTASINLAIKAVLWYHLIVNDFVFFQIPQSPSILSEILKKFT